ncbi:hypothetical protein [Paraburkholderia bannensis]
MVLAIALPLAQQGNGNYANIRLTGSNNTATVNQR